MFEHLMMEARQCGLSWSLMLKKREIFRECFDDFDYDRTGSSTITGRIVPVTGRSMNITQLFEKGGIWRNDQAGTDRLYL